MIINFSNLGGGGGGGYVLPTATDSRLGGVKIGSGVNVDSAGTISVEAYQLSAATQNTLGGVMIGSGITVDSAGTISAQEYTLPTASSEVLGGVKVGSGLTITNDGVLSSEGNDENVQHVYSAETIWNVPYQLKEGDVVYIPEHDEEFKVSNYVYQTMANNDCGLLEALEIYRNIDRGTIRRIVLKLQENENYDPETVEDINDKEVFIVRSDSEYFYGFWFYEGDYYYLSGATQIDVDDISNWTLVDSSPDVDGFEVVIDIDEGSVDEHTYPDPTHFYPYHNTYTPYYCDVDITHVVYFKTYQYSVGNFIELNDLVDRVDILRQDLDIIDETISQDYTPTSGFTTINGSAITEGGNMVISADSTKIEEITELPSSPIDGAVYNYNGVLIKYVNGAGKWGEWYNDVSHENDSTDSNVRRMCAFNYATLPQSVDGNILITFRYSSDFRHFIFDLANDRIVVKSDTASTDNLYVIQHNGSEVNVIVGTGSTRNVYAKWEGNIISFAFAYLFTTITSSITGRHNMLQATASTAHYELFEEPKALTSSNLYKNLYGGMSSVYGGGEEGSRCVLPKLVDANGRILEVGSIGNFINSRVNGSYVKKIMYNAGDSRSTLPDMYVPTTSGATGTLLVSQGNAAPQWKTTVQALGVDFWHGTQDEYDAIATKSATTLYIIIPDDE